uniref:ATPase n=1 Tax=Neobacillus citreus TaxID=2833578 RepID=A0A942T7J0_9BACI
MVSSALKALTFGQVDSESETDLDKLFVRTGDFDSFASDSVWLALGAKGTGKSALFELFTRFESTTRSLTGAAMKDVIVAAGTGFGDLSEVATGDIQQLRDSESNFDHDRLWRLYIAIKAGLALDKDFKIPKGPLKDLLRALHERKDLRVGPLLKEMWEIAVGSAPSSVTITAGGASIALQGGSRALDVVTLLSDVNTALQDKGKRVWLLFDKIDEIWPSDRAERKRALEGLLTAAMHIRRTFPAIQPKVLLRADLWTELDLTNKDHLTDKRIELNWKSPQLTTLLLKRALASAEVRQYVEDRKPALINKAVEELSIEDREDALVTIFPGQVYTGQREAKTPAWIAERVVDGRGTVLPRDAINLANAAARAERDRGGESTGTLLSRESVREGFTKASEVRCESFLAEFPDLRDHFRRFAGQQTSEFSRDALLSLMADLEPSGDDLLERLYEIGVVAPDTKKVLTATSYSVPRLYRTGLGLVIRGRP